jgi:hypothetical protein
MTIEMVNHEVLLLLKTYKLRREGSVTKLYIKSYIKINTLNNKTWEL